MLAAKLIVILVLVLPRTLRIDLPIGIPAPGVE
jgi:hypothetical protein